jgi:hypothetical protein
MAVVYSEIAQADDDSREAAQSSPLSGSPAHSFSSPAPFLASPESRYTPLSLSSDPYQEGMGDEVSPGAGQGRSFKASMRTIASAATLITGATANTTIPAQATSVPKRGDGYHLLSPPEGFLDTTYTSLPTRSGCAQEGVVNIQTNTGSDSKASQTLTRKGTSQSSQPTVSYRQEPTSSRPLITARASGPPSVQQATPVIRSRPILRTASTKSVTLVHPSPGGSKSRSSSYASNIAQLELTAEKLSMTSSIEDAIRDLHDEQKRSDSRRSSILAASISSGPEANTAFPLTRQVSAASSILETNDAARYGGYSPAGYVMSPTISMISSPTQLHAASFPRVDVEPETLLSRQGVGKTSVRAAKSTTKPSLTDIAEMEPTTLTPAALDGADRLAEDPEEEETLRIPPMEEIDLTSPVDPPDVTFPEGDYVRPVVNAQHERYPAQEERRATMSSSTASTTEQADRAFADFDGAHCPPDVDSVAIPVDQETSLGNSDPTQPRISRPSRPRERPKSYMDPQTGQQMLYYPARVPLMLNLPKKLSKKAKSAENQKRVPQILDTMPETSQQPINWLPEVLPEPLLNPLGSVLHSDPTSPVSPSSPSEQHPMLPLIVEDRSPLRLSDEVASYLRPNPHPIDEEARKSHVSASLAILDSTDKRKSQLPILDGAPPHLRANAFFDLPSGPSLTLELKDGSATATLDEILNASAKAPVSAFTDHVFAGKLGNEVYGHETRRRTHLQRASTATVLDVAKPKEVKKRSSFFHLRAPSKLSLHPGAKEERRNTIMGGTSTTNISEAEADGPKMPDSIDAEHVNRAEGGAGDEESEEEPTYQGPPTTLLAELQMRKQQHMMRTRPITEAFPNGVHSTLLEMDSVAEVERRNRHGKRINLAWQDTDPMEEESDDEDTPLGLLMAAKKAGTGIAAVQAEMNRPLGLVELREQEENEPLSQRRARLQGRVPISTQRQTMMALGNASALRMAPNVSGPASAVEGEEEEEEGETLGQRMQRLKAQDEAENPLPRTRPVSRAFSAELLSELGIGDEEPDTVGEKSKESVQPKVAEEEGETLGQRRRRLRAEREAQRKEPAAEPTVKPDASKRLSMADVLGATAAASRRVPSDPRIDAERARTEETTRYKREQEKKMAALRSQMPTNLSQPNLLRSGGYMAGQFNGMGGGPGSGRPTSAYVPQQGPLNTAPQQYSGYGMNHHARAASSFAAYGAAPFQMQMQTMQMPVQQPGPQQGMVDRWRQSIIP